MANADPQVTSEPVPAFPARRILVVDDEPLKRITLQIELSEHGYEVYEAADARAARQVFDNKPIDVVVTDVRMPGVSGLDLLSEFKQSHPEVEVILMTAYATVDTAVLAMKRGAYDYITKPFTTAELIEKLERLFASALSGRGPERTERCGRMVAQNAAMCRVLEQARAVAGAPRLVLITGPRGVGKSILADAIHTLSGADEQELVRLDCGGAPPAAFDNLFPQTGNGVSSGGAGGGAMTVLLDDVDLLSDESQARLLAMLNQQAFEREAERNTPLARARLLVTSRRDICQMADDGQYLQDLCERLTPLAIDMPPLRQRTDDIPALARHFIEKHRALCGDRDVRITQSAIDELLQYDWPGNVRELESKIERALALCGGDEIRPEHVLPLARERDEADASGAMDLSEVGRLGLHDTVADIERRMILTALRQSNNNQARAAQRLGIPRTTLRDKMAKYGISPG